MDCPFCNINFERNRVIKGEKNYFITLSNPRLVPGHFLVIARRHVERLSQLNKEEREDIFDAVINLQEKILKKVSSGCDIRTNFRPFIKQNGIKVDHFHIHLLPRELDDELQQTSQRSEKELWKVLPEVEKEKFIKIPED